MRSNAGKNIASSQDVSKLNWTGPSLESYKSHQTADNPDPEILYTREESDGAVAAHAADCKYCRCRPGRSWLLLAW